MLYVHTKPLQCLPTAVKSDAVVNKSILTVLATVIIIACIQAHHIHVHVTLSDICNDVSLVKVDHVRHLPTTATLIIG